MFERLLPRLVDNTYRGHKLALWLFAPVVIMKIAMGLNAIFNGHLVASSADGIPLDTFTDAGARTVVALFAIWGLAQLVICSLCVLALVRYRSAISFMFALLLLEFLSRKVIFYFLPLARTELPVGVIVNLILLAMMIVGLALALWNKGTLEERGGRT